ncbi:MAG TPA: hypothetical protein P5186_03900 [Candidatus Paceibacterota bacterium]|nr:hypothetical protein [Verrucomicrobiota bacterium]HRY47171.1 hypothetical protein [Candidatus Paceibacterota bacterium]HRZ99708.1 hypothetical protein [Candidatus Paceibacterota bacterium]
MTPGQVCKQHYNRIVSGGLLAAEGILFATGLAIPSGNSAKARLLEALRRGDKSLDTLASLEYNLTADGCNLAGRCLMLTDLQILAAPFFAQALRLAPNHPYAGGNFREALAWVSPDKDSTKDSVR